MSKEKLFFAVNFMTSPIGDSQKMAPCFPAKDTGYTLFPVFGVGCIFLSRYWCFIFILNFSFSLLYSVYHTETAGGWRDEWSYQVWRHLMLTHNTAIIKLFMLINCLKKQRYTSILSFLLQLKKDFRLLIVLALTFLIPSLVKKKPFKI